MTENEKIIEKVRKCLALAYNNSNASEAESAALAAQKLMAKHGISAIDVESEMTVEEQISIVREETGGGKAWKYILAHIVAENFRCKTFFYGRTVAAFYGYKTDAGAAKEVFRFLFKMGHKLADSERVKYRNRTGTSTGVYNSYVRGFLVGLKLKLDQQSVALMITIPEKVTTEYGDFMQNAKTIKGGMQSSTFRPEAYANGVSQGKRAMGSRELTSK